MKYLNGKGGKFYMKWEKIRKHKWQYVFSMGVITSLLMTPLMFFLKSDLRAEHINLAHLPSDLLYYGILGIIFGLINYRYIDKMYLSLIDDNFDILDGIKTLKSGKTWNYENITIKKVNSDTLIVSNKLLLLENMDNQSAKLEECFDSVYADYKRINEVGEFESFAKKHKVKIQIFEVQDNETPLIDKLI